MYPKELLFSKEAQEKVLEGINIVSDAVKVTYGPQGNCVIIGDIDKPLRVTKDGVSVAKEVEVDDLFKNIGVSLIKETASKTVAAVGDATTTSTILAQALCSSIFSSSYKEKPLTLKREINNGLSKVLKYIDSLTRPLTDDDIINIATISANNDPELGKMIGEAFKTVGKDGVITVEESVNETTSVDVINGMRIDRGYLAPHFATDYVKDQCILENPLILITEHKINKISDLKDILVNCVDNSRSLLIIAEDYDDSVIETLKLNKLQGTLKVCPIKAPSFGEYRSMILGDIAVLTNGYNVSYDSGLEVWDINSSHLGNCSKVIVTKDHTTIINGAGSKENIDLRVQEIRNKLKDLESDPSKDGSYLITLNRERIAKLIGGIGCIYVGGITDLERGERKDRVEDAVFATRSALEEGIVCGGGLAYYMASKCLDRSVEGENILYNVLRTPINLLAKSCDITIDESIESQFTEEVGLNAKTGTIVNMYETGIIDPAKCIKTALENAVSVALTFLSTKCVIVPKVAR